MFREERKQVDGMLSLFENMKMPEYTYKADQNLHSYEETKIAPQKSPYNYNLVILIVNNIGFN